MKISKNAEPIKAGRRYFLEIVAVDEKRSFSLSPYGNIKLNPSHIRNLYSVATPFPAFDRCRDCAHAKAAGNRNVTCKKSPSVNWSKMSKACEDFKPKTTP